MESTRKSIGKVIFFRGVTEGESLWGNPPYFNNPIVYVSLYYANIICESTKSWIIKIYDGGTYRYQSTDENFKLLSQGTIITRRNKDYKEMFSFLSKVLN